MNFLRNILKSLEQGRPFDSGEDGPHQRAFLEEMARQASLRVIVERDGVPWRELCLLKTGDTQSLTEVVPGAYTIKLSTGRVLWEGELTADQLLWQRAFPERDLPMAANTGAGQEACTVFETLIPQELDLRISPGLHAGRITLQFQKQR